LTGRHSSFLNSFAALITEPRDTVLIRKRAGTQGNRRNVEYGTDLKRAELKILA